MPESRPCESCGRFHEPGPCPKEDVLEKPGKELTPEEKQEQEKMQGQLEDWLSKGNMSEVTQVISLFENKNIALDFNKSGIATACQKGMKSCLGIEWHGMRFFSIPWAEQIISFSEKNNIFFDVATICQKGVELYLSQGSIRNAEEIISFCEDKHIVPDITIIFQKEVERCLSHNSIGRVEEIISLAEKKSIALDLDKPEIATFCQTRLESDLSQGDIYFAGKIISFCEDKHIILDLSKLKITAACQKGLESCLYNGNIQGVEKIISFCEDKHIILDLSKPGIIALCQKGLRSCLSHCSISCAEELSSFCEKKNIALDFSEPEITTTCKQTMEHSLSNGDIPAAEQLISFCEKKNIAFYFSKLRMVILCQKGLEHCLSDHDFTKVEKIVSFCEKKNIPLNFKKPNIVIAYQKRVAQCFYSGNVSEIGEIISLSKKKNIPLDITTACQEWMVSLLSGNETSEAERFLSFCEDKHIPLDITTACQEGIEFCLSKGDILEVKQFIHLSKERNITLDFNKPEIAAACQKGLESWLSHGDCSNPEQIISFCEDKHIPLNVATPLEKVLESSLSKGDISATERIISFCEKKKITIDIVVPFQKVLETHLIEYNIPAAEAIISFCEDRHIMLDAASTCQKWLEKLLLDESLELDTKLKRVMEINQHFLRLSPEKAFELYSHHLPLKELENNLPSLLLQAQKSIELLFSLFEYRENPEDLINAVEKNPFLLDALKENPRFCPKLILQYPKFDRTSRSKIKFLFENKKEILKDNPDLDPGSLEFRQEMQSRLLGFDRNQKIIKESKKAGIDTDEWLNYEATEYFALKSGEEMTSFSERVSTPLDRLGQTIGSYAHQIKVVLSEWREDLLKIEIEPASVEEDKMIITQMEVDLIKAQEAGEERKAKGLSRGLEGMRQKSGQVKKLPLWNRLMSEIDGFAKLKDSLVQSQESLILTEQKYDNFASSKAPSGAELSKLKSQLSQAKDDFRKRLGQLERRIETFRTNLPILLSGLGKDRAIFLEVELNGKMVEQFSHYDSDRETLESLFSERADKEKEKLEDRPMSVFIWARNPDVDLYQGNYSPCCISIEQNGRGNPPDSAIADYATDLGIQIVNIWDEQKNEPVVAAWCWLGKDENGKTALVVDNIEANIQYSSNFPSELTKELFDYLKKYAEAIKVDRLVLGKANNDLPTRGEMAKLYEAGVQYSKLGGQNSRYYSGYYLEAEEVNVKLLWKKGQEQKTKKENLLKMEIKDLLVKDLSANDFTDIIKLEKQIYEEELVRGQAMIDDLNNDEGLKYSVAIYGKRPQQTKDELLGYLIAYKDKSKSFHGKRSGRETEGFTGIVSAYQDKINEAKPRIYLDDIAIAPDCQGSGLGWNLLEKAIEHLKTEAQKQGKPILFNMHLKEGSQKLFEKHKEDLERLGVYLIESVFIPDYYDEGEDALYCVYEIKTS